jgi:glucose uptake protein
MAVPHSYDAALALMLLSMVCWGSWANTQKIDRMLRFELYYWDYMLGITATTLVAGLVLGEVVANLREAAPRSVADAFVAGVIFNVGNVLLVAAIALAGMAIAFPIGAGLGLVIGSVLNFITVPRGNPWLLFGGIALVCGAIALNAAAYLAAGHRSARGSKGIAASIASGVAIGLFYPLVVKAYAGPGALDPYSVALVFSLGALLSYFPLSRLLMRHPLSGERLSAADYFRLRPRAHLLGLAGGLVWAVGTIANFVASYVPLVGPATSFALGQGNTMISALWGVAVWKEFRGAPPRATRLLGAMFVLFVVGLAAIGAAPLFD